MRESHGPASVIAALRILATSDVHMHLTGWNAQTDRTHTNRAFSRLAAEIARARDAAPGAVLLVDNGDALQGTAVADHLAASGQADKHPWPRILTALKYDAVGLGNHDFDYGLRFLHAVMGEAHMPTLCANTDPPLPAPLRRRCLIDRQVACSDGDSRRLRVGITSVLPAQTALWNGALLGVALDFTDPVAAARREIEALRDEGADIVLVLCHGGLGTDITSSAENFATAMAQVPGIDAMVMGHSHRRFPGTGHMAIPGIDTKRGTVAGVPAVMPGFGASDLGQIDLDLRWHAGGWLVSDFHCTLRKPQTDAQDRAVTRLAAPAEAATRRHLERPLARADHTFHSYFAMLRSGMADALMADALMHVIAGEVAGTDLADLPLIAAVAPLAAGGLSGPDQYVDVPAGTVTERHLAMICPFRNTVSALVLTGAQLRAWAARSALFFDPRSDGPLVATDAPAFYFDALHGLDTVVDPTRPPGPQRIRSLTYKGAEIGAEDRFVVAMTGYRAAGGGGYPGSGPDAVRIESPVDTADALRDHLRAKGSVGPARPSAWRFARNIGRRCIIETAPQAVDHLDEIARFSPEPLDLTGDGFLQIRVTL